MLKNVLLRYYPGTFIDIRYKIRSRKTPGNAFKETVLNKSENHEENTKTRTSEMSH